jgi:hypothetical protein
MSRCRTQVSLTDAQRCMLRAIDDTTGGDWEEIERLFKSRRPSKLPTYLEAATCKSVGDALQRKGLILEEDHGPVFTPIGLGLLALHGRKRWRLDGTMDWAVVEGSP